MAPDEQERTPVAEDAEDEPGRLREPAQDPARGPQPAPRRRRRDAERQAAASGTPGRSAAPEPSGAPVPTPVADPAAAGSRLTPAPTQSRGIEDVAWAGVAAAAEAATIGVRLANRALEAMRDTVDRR